MRVSAKVETIDRDIVLRLVGDDADRSRQFAAYAREALVEAQEVNRRATGQVPTHETFVDGRRGAALETVKPDGTIVFEFDLLNDLFEWIGLTLMQHSPVLSGRYQESHLFFADGVEVEPGATLPEAQEYSFVNAQPYARKIERGQSPMAPDGVYEAVATLASRRFSNVARVRFGYRSLPAGSIGDWAKTTNMRASQNSRNRPGDKRFEWLTRQPAVVITLR
ncbi:hypothetical protein [Ancylobacter sp. IITR112]|uniref:hypothetical protein n=1 Tax=Ancylobacter sp. IITR112 TaxID=3138073 RepID=UPI00352BC75B